MLALPRGVVTLRTVVCLLVALIKKSVFTGGKEVTSQIQVS